MSEIQTLDELISINGLVTTTRQYNSIQRSKSQRIRTFHSTIIKKCQYDIRRTDNSTFENKNQNICHTDEIIIIIIITIIIIIIMIIMTIILVIIIIIIIIIIIDI